MSRWARIRTLGFAFVGLTPCIARPQAPGGDTTQALRRALAAQGITVASVVGVHRTPRFIIVDTHIYHHNNVHFAPTHWAEVWTWDPTTRRDVRLYPRAPYDSVRRAYVDTVKSIYARAGQAWFRANNHHMDAERFDTRLGDTVVVAPSGRTVAFPITFGGGEGTPAETPPLEIVVVCRDVGTERSRCREHPLAALARTHPGQSTLDILDEVVGTKQGLPSRPPVLTIEGSPRPQPYRSQDAP